MQLIVVSNESFSVLPVSFPKNDEEITKYEINYLV